MLVVRVGRYANPKISATDNREESIPLVSTLKDADMSHRAFGMSFLAIAAMLFATRFICAALMAWDDFKYDPEGNYARALRAIPSELSTAAWISFAVGACYLIIMEMHSYIEWRRNYPKNGES